jgi:hypothetical protein
MTFAVPIAWDETGDFIHANTSHLVAVHRATMAGLSPSTRYTYRVGNEPDGWSSAFDFKSLPSPGSGTKPGETPLRIAILGDFGLKNAQTLAAMEDEVALVGDLDAFVHVGDMACEWRQYCF